VAKTKKAKTTDDASMDRRSSDDRRQAEDRRKVDKPVDVDQRKGPRRNVTRRRQIDPTTCERDYTNDEIEFMQAMDAYKRSSGRMFPTCSEILEVVRDLGYTRELKTPDVSAEAQPVGTPAALESETESSTIDLTDGADGIGDDDFDDDGDF